MVSFPKLWQRKTDITEIVQARFVGNELSTVDDIAPIRSALQRELSNVTGGYGVSDNALTAVIASTIPVFACLNWLANTARTVPFQVTDAGGDVIENGGQFWYFLANQAEGILADAVRSLNVWGKVFLRKQYNASGFPTGLEFINPNNITQDIDRHTRQITGYTMKVGNEKLQPHQIIYISLFSYSGDGNPLSPTEAAFTQAGISQGIATHAATFFFNSATPTGIVTFDPPLQPAQFEVAKSRWRTEFKGARNANKVGLFNHKLEYTSIQQALKDLAMDSLNDNAKQQICAAFGVNQAVVGLGDVSQGLGSNTTYKDTERSSISNTLVPLTKLVAEALTQQWAAVDFSPPNYYSVIVNEKAVPGLSNVNTERVNMTNTLIGSNSISYNEQRGILGLTERENTEDRLYLEEVPKNAIELWRNGLATFNESRLLIGLDAVLSGDVLNVSASQIQVPIKELGSLFAKPSYLPFASPQVTIQQASEIAESSSISVPSPPPATTNPAGEAPAIIEGLSIRATLPASIAVCFAGHNLVKMARRTLATSLAEVDGVVWAADDDWRLELFSIANCTPAMIGDMIKSFEAGNRRRVELTTGDYVIKDNAIYLAIQDTRELAVLSGSLRTELKADYGAATSDAPMLGIKLCTCHNVTTTMLGTPPVAAPLVADNLALYVDDHQRYIWQVERVTEAQRKELRNWQYKINRCLRKSEPLPTFNIEALPQHVVDYVRSQLAMEGAPDIAAIFSEAKNRLDMRAIQATRIDYELAVEALIEAQQAGQVNRTRFGTILRNENTKAIRNAYRDGLIEGGVLDAEMTDDDRLNIENLIDEGNSFVAAFADKLFAGEVTDKDLIGKPAVWYRGTVVPAYNGGLISANKNGMFEFTGLPGADSCEDCQRLEGQVHRLSAWEKRNLLVPQPGQDTDCGGWQCNHVLKPTSDRAKGSF